MPVYKYTLKNGKTMWYAAFNYTDWTGQNRHTCKRRFKTQQEAKEYERPFLDQEKNTRDIHDRRQATPLLWQAESVRH